MSQQQHENASSAKSEIETLQETVTKLEHALAVEKIHNPINYLTERQRIALSGKWSSMKQAERDSFAALLTGNSDTTVSYCTASLVTEAENKIFSENRNAYIGSMLQWYMSLNSEVENIRTIAESTIIGVRESIRETQALNLLSAVKGKLFEKKTSLPPEQLAAFALLCVTMGHDLDAVK